MTEEPRLPTSCLARELLRAEACGGGPACAPDACRAVLDRLYDELETLIGRGAYHALLIRALALAGKDHPSLRRLDARRASAPGLEGLEENLRAVEPEDPEAVAKALVKEFLELLVRILGPRLTRTIVRSGWPEAKRLRPDRPDGSIADD